jgi:hypothetical protein
MEETFVPPDPGFVVEWQLADVTEVIDLSESEAEIVRAAGTERPDRVGGRSRP